MAIPKNQELRLPLLRLISDGREYSNAETVTSLAAQFNLSRDERAVMVPSGRERQFDNRVRWAKVALRKAGLLDIPREGFVTITASGKKLLDEPPQVLDNTFLMRYAGFAEWVSGGSTSEDQDFGDGAEFLHNALERTLDEYLAAKEEEQKDHPFAKWFRDLPEQLSRRLSETKKYKIDASVGHSGNWAYVPWITLRRLDLAPTVQTGLYVAYLFRSDMSALYLSLNQGVTEAKTGSSGKLAALRQRATHYRQLVSVPDRLRLSEIHLPEPRTALAANYEAAHVWGVEYRADDLPDPVTLRKDLDDMLSAYQTIDPQIEIVPVESAEISFMVAPDPYSLTDLQRDILWDSDRLSDLISSLAPDDLTLPARPLILVGPPGTGKTWLAQHVVRYLTKDDSSRWRLVQFHPSFSYEQFIEGLRPQVVDNALQFEIAPGVIRRLADSCSRNDARHFLIIDEMNRANLPRVFGELMYLLEYRDQEVQLPFSGPFRLPRNLAFIGTMNTADRSIRSIDIALRRRFDIFECPAERKVLERYYQGGGNHNLVRDLFEGFDALNSFLTSEIDQYHTIGQTFFMKKTFTPEALRWSWAHQVRPTLEEYFFDEPKRMEAITVDRFWKSLS
jgi:MrcB-like, N-terminal domain/Mrr N-terminal domain/AAA domain (dynein-related subfamily)